MTPDTDLPESGDLCGIGGCVRRQEDLLDMARAAVAADQAHRSWDLLDRITASLYQLGLSLQTATGLPADAARRATADALQHLDDTLREIREETFPDCD